MTIAVAPTASLAEMYAALMAQYPPRCFSVNDVSWRLIDTGVADKAEAETVLLLPGALGRGETTFEYIAAIAASGRWRVLSPDYPRSLSRLHELTEELAALLSFCGVSAVHLVGGSFGGLVAQSFAARFPARVQRLILTDTTAPTRFRQPQMQAANIALRLLPEGVIRKILRAGIRDYLKSVPAADRGFWSVHFEDAIAALTRTDFMARSAIWADFDGGTVFPDRQNGVLIVTAADDPMISPAARRALQKRYPSAATHTIQGGGHAASIANAASYIAVILAFLEASS
jgi:pimeloyl-ACP methyl ester carboxylesterase